MVLELGIPIPNQLIGRASSLRGNAGAEVGTGRCLAPAALAPWVSSRQHRLRHTISKRIYDLGRNFKESRLLNDKQTFFNVTTAQSSPSSHAPLVTYSCLLRFTTSYVVVHCLCRQPTPTPIRSYTKQRHLVTIAVRRERSKKLWALEISRRYVARAHCQCAPLWVLRIPFRIARRASKQFATPEALNWPTPSSSRLQPISYTYWH